MSDHWDERLSEYLDGTLAGRERAECEAHLADCPQCAATLAELRAVVERAAALRDAPPPEDLWPGIAARIGASPAPRVVRPLRPARRFVLSVPQLAAAAAALVLVTAALVWIAARGLPGRSVREVAVTAPRDDSSAAYASFQDPRYEAEVAALKRALEQGRDRLDPATVRTLEDNLRIIELATEQARRALASDPANVYLRDHLTDTMKRKLDLLRHATQLASVQ